MTEEKNSRLRKDNSTGYKGVVRYNKKFQAQYHINGTTKYIGTFFTAEEAAEAYIDTIERIEGMKK